MPMIATTSLQILSIREKYYTKFYLLVEKRSPSYYVYGWTSSVFNGVGRDDVEPGKEVEVGLAEVFYHASKVLDFVSNFIIKKSIIF